MTNNTTTFTNKSKKNKEVNLEPVIIDNESYFKISNNDEMRPFFMSMVSDSNHWMFISSNGGLTAGRKNSEFALFPYYSDDKITESSEITGPKSIFQVTKNGETYIWEPFSIRFEDNYVVKRNLYKSVYGNAIIFEEENLDLEITYRYQWASSDKYGFVKTSKLINNAETEVSVSVLDGIQNILPYGVGSDLQNGSSNLVDAYKRSELLTETGLGIFALSAIIVDKAEPSEALKANIVWSTGFDNPKYLLSSLQLNNFRKFQPIHQEEDVKAEKGAYFINAEVSLVSKEAKQWAMVANVNKNQSAVVELSNSIKSNKDILKTVKKDIALGTEKLIALNAATDGLQLTSDNYRDTRHFANTLFNIMRGGIFDDSYKIEKWDFKNYLAKANRKVSRIAEDIVEALPNTFSLSLLQDIGYKSENKNFRRLCLEYLPLKFSRRHGDPSRPWNKFSINTQSEVDGSKILDYEGNWRDIFQNWEALAHSYPEFMESMIHKFLNATTFDGYNPYRVTKEGFDWETIEPDDPWSYIGYWGDHQIIYLLKFLEFIENYKPGKLESFFNKDLFVYANVPYKIKAYEDILKNPKDTIEFDVKLDASIREERAQIGADGALLRDENRFIVKANFIEKILATALAKLSNFIPEGGIWMNTQRPEWNDANNALVGNGVSMVTLYYLRRFLKFFDSVFSKVETESVEVSNELLVFFNAVTDTFKTNQNVLSGTISDSVRKQIMDQLGQAASNYRSEIYNQAFSGRKTELAIQDIKEFVQVSLEFLEHSIKANKRADNLYHAYNLMTLNADNSVSIAYLDEMLEGQVAVLSSGYLSSKESLEVLDSLKNSKLFREDQYSYILYPNKKLKGFMERNIVPSSSVRNSKLLQQLVEVGNTQIIEQDENGNYHFNGNFKNAKDLKLGLQKLEHTQYADLANKEEKSILQIFEGVFNHKAFTGRSGTFYGYEGLGSIYWHMVSKLQLATLECCLIAIDNKENKDIIGRLLEHYYEINEGIGVHKSPQLYGAFPTDPYSHTPAGKGAQQPGMTGQVKEDVLSRFAELGAFVEEGKLYFNPCLLRKNEFLEEDKTFHYINLEHQKKSISLQENELAYTYCQVPIIYKIADQNCVEVTFKDETVKVFHNLSLDVVTSTSVFNRVGEVIQINVSINSDCLK
ncbi:MULTISPECIES: hypothetical protein [Winogradskyella]|uniref:hypothetical protein n=1 Tax=Winogradskyella TaxID=286104 RepID=UPI0015CDF251|nr:MULTISPECIES: hypothetical protein [Winogradskyella]QNK77368.1 hypothetical protein H7F37_14885 [Winogradskyella sp. PAMC22761]QXP80081.1 hypothetical protein H0I32_05455 [Winogradskyella sp. HaHa_3_26]